MKMLPRALLGAGATFLVSVSLCLAAPAPDLDQRLAAAVSTGRVDRAHADLYRLYAVVAPDSLPAEFQEGPGPRRAAAVRRPSLRCGTEAFRAARAGLASMPPDVRAKAQALLEPAGLPAAAAPGRSVRHVLLHWLETEHFSIEWGPALTDEDGTTPPRDEDRNGIPDVVELWAAYFEASYRHEVEESGFARAALATRLVPVYLGNSKPNSTLTSISAGTYAFTNEHKPTPYILVNNDFSFVPPNGEGDEGLPMIHGAMKVTAAHEFFHVLQFLTPLPYAWSPHDDDWWLEASATWMEDEVFDRVNDYYQYFDQSGGLPGWADFAAAGLPVASDDPDFIVRAYGDVIFAKYLSEHVGGRASLKAIWDLIGGGRRILFDNSARTSTANGALTLYAQAKGLSSVERLFLGFSAANATMDYREGAHYGAVPVTESPRLTAAGPPPAYLGASYVLRGAPGTGAGLTVDLSGTPAVSWGLAFSLGRGTQYALALGAQDGGGEPSLAVSRLEADDALYAVPSFLRPGKTASAWALAETAGGPTPAVPAAVTGLSATAAPAGLDVAWGAPPGPTAGSVVRWRPQGGAAAFSSRTLFGPVTSAELRSLAGETSYDVEVFAYDPAGAEGASASTVGTAGPAPDPTVPPAPVLDDRIRAALTGILPSKGGRGLEFPVTILGRNLQLANAVTVSGRGVTATVTAAYYDRVEALFRVAAAAPSGTRTVAVTTRGPAPTFADGVTVKTRFTVNAGPLVFSSISPKAAAAGDTVDAVIYGTGLDQVTSVAFKSALLAAEILPGATVSSLPVRIAVGSGARPGSYPFTLQTSAQTAKGTFSVAPSP